MSSSLSTGIAKATNIMIKPTHMYDSMGRRKEGVVKAVAAARFEDALQTFNRLCSRLLSFSHLITETEAIKQLEDVYARFSTWGHETGAEDLSLDRRLRKSKELHETVIDILHELQSALDDGMQLVEEQQFADWTKQLIEQQDFDPPAIIEEMAQDEVDPRDTGPTGPPVDDAQATVLMERLLEAVDEISGNVDNLIMLGPSLERPYPQDIDAYASSISNTSDISDSMDIERACLEFPIASSILQKRLGRANWKRRIAQMVVHEQNRKDGKIHPPRQRTKKTVRQEVAQDAFNFQQPTLRREKLVVVPKFLPLMSVTASTAEVSDTASDLWDTNPRSSTSKLNRANSATTLATMATYESNKKVQTGMKMLQLAAAKEAMFPKTPVQLTEIPKGRTVAFTCNFCGYDLEAGGRIQTEEDWNQHLLEDLEPYLCTFDKCFSAQETYARRDEWYRHELESHRVHKAWVCPACREEFKTKQEATEHLMQIHCCDFKNEKEVVMMKAMLKQTLSSRILGTQICPLCGEKLEARRCKEHIARHLECFALLSIAEEATSDEDESDDIFSQSDDAMSDRGRKELVLSTFVREQFNLNLERGQQPPDRFMDGGGGLDLLEDMSECGDSKDSEPRIGNARQRESTQMLMDKMFHGYGGAHPTIAARRTATTTAETSGKRAARWPQQQQQQQVGGPPSLASLTEKLPLLRTWSFPRNADFMGRDRELANLYKILSEPGKVCVVSGEGGMGKTALAVEYTWRYEQSYHYIFWVQAETPVGSSDTFCQIAQQMRLVPEGTDQETMIRLGREFLEGIRDKRWLMVLDNVEKWDDIDVYTPTKTSATQGSILITTRHESLTAPSRPVNYFRTTLQELSIEEGRQLLIHGLPEDLRPKEMSLRDREYKVAGEIAGLVGLPLLIVYISGYIKNLGCTLSEFWEYWNEWRPNARLSGSGGGSGDAGGEAGKGSGDVEDDATEGTSKRDTSGREGVFYMALRDLSTDEKKLLKIMAFLDSDGIQRELLEWNDASRPGPGYLKKSRLRLIISKLKGQSIVTEKRQGERETYNVHRLLQARLLQDMNGNQAERDEIFMLAFSLIRSRLPRPSLDTPEPHKWNAFKEYLPHVLSLQRAYANPLSIVTVRPFRGLAELFKDGGVLLWQRYVHGDALKLLHSAEKILDQVRQYSDKSDKSDGGHDEGDSDEDENLRAEVNITINLLLQYFGISFRKEIRDRSAAILAYHERVARRRGRDKGVDDGDHGGSDDYEDQLMVSNARADYANTLLQFNDFRQAEPIYEACLATFSAAASTSAKDNSDSNTAFALAKLHHHLAYCRMYRHQFDEAVELADQAVRIIERVSDMAMALRYRFDLACITLQSGRREQALALHQGILKARLGFQGRASYFTLQSQYAVAALCHYLGQLEEAEMLMKSALSKAAGRGGKNFWPDAAVARTKYHLSLVMAERDSSRGLVGMDEELRTRRQDEARKLAFEAKDVLSRMLPYDPEPITGVREEDTLALFDHLQPVFGGRFTSTKLLGYIS
ncbi:nb-arc domain containing protein [Grosmannia clavigera kw1407]|uniref:Nb-arc domain containing protein n=1 Tax=Grosmannia clavigera (strain kw1407 / UAMH 11150) TaxID=655863 RepID=F0X6X9_GROCL|nr:nb-arc domain containing protein [Grosmannia clavigera kw1407]EFX06376.1 nb-arc domain containing protein [Grosmannia clavigera kw1407]